MGTLKLFMLLLGGRPAGRHTEQHDIFFGIGSSLKELVPYMKQFWPEAKNNLHVDAWREVTTVDGYKVVVTGKTSHVKEDQLFFINLGGYQQGVFDELHFKMLAIQKTKGLAVKQAKQTIFYKDIHFPGASSHIDDHHGIDVDDLYLVSDILPQGQKGLYSLSIIKTGSLEEDKVHLGYFKLSSFK